MTALCRFKSGLIFTSVLLCSCLAPGADLDYYARLSATIQGGEKAFITDPALVDPANTNTVLPNTISFARFANDGELNGVRLGMSMEEVVGVWGKPQSLYGHCVIGPRFYYGSLISLFFQGDRLMLIGLTGKQAHELNFDNGLKGEASSQVWTNTLGAPRLDLPRFGIFEGTHSYAGQRIKTDLSFYSSFDGEGTNAVEQLMAISVRLFTEIVPPKRGIQFEPPKLEQPAL